eukprot:163582_1
MKNVEHTKQDEEHSLNKIKSLSVDYGTINTKNECGIENTATQTNTNASYMMGVLLMLSSSLFLSFQGVCVQIGKDLHYQAFELLIARGIGQVIVNLIFQLFGDRFTRKQTNNRLDYTSFDAKLWFYLIARGICGFTTAILLYDGVQLLPLGDAMSLWSTFPIWTIMISYVFLKEQITKIHIISLISGMGGIILITQPTFIFRTMSVHINALGVFLCLLGAVLNGFTFLCLRKMKHIKAIYPVYSMSIGCIVGSVIYGLITGMDNWHGISMNNYYDIVLLVSIGIMGFGGQWFMTKSTQYVAASVGSLVRSTDVAWAYI